MKLEYKVNRGVFLGPKLYALESDSGVVMKVKGLHETKLSFEDMLTLLDNNSLKTTHTIWKRNMKEGLITLKEQLFSIGVTSTKREIIRDINGKFIDTKPYNINKLLNKPPYPIINPALFL